MFTPFRTMATAVFTSGHGGTGRVVRSHGQRWERRLVPAGDAGWLRQ